MQPIIINQPKVPKTITTKYTPDHKCYKTDESLYRITFKYKTNFSDNKIYNITANNMNFTKFVTPKRELRSGDLVRYIPKKKKNDPNYNQIARITKKTIKRSQEKRDVSFNIKFLNPIIVNNKIKKEMLSVSPLSLKYIHEIEQFICEKSFIPKSLVDKYIKLRNAYNNKIKGYNIANLKDAQNKLWNTHFVLNDNNEPKYPKWSDYGQPLYKDQLYLRQRLNSLITNIVRESFIPSRNKIFKKQGKWWIKFIMPEGSQPGDSVSVSVDSTKVNVNIPNKSTNKTFFRPNTEIEVEILKENNSEIYDALKNTSSKKINLEFIPTFISAEFSNDKQLDLQKLVKPSKNQKFKIKDAEIIKQNGDNFIFKKLKKFDKQATIFVYDLEVLIELTLEMEYYPTVEEKEKEANTPFFERNITKGIRNLRMKINNSTQNCKNIKKKIQRIFKTITSPSAAQIQAKNVIHRFASRAEKVKTKADRKRIVQIQTNNSLKRRALKAKGNINMKSTRKRITQNRSSSRPNVRGGRRRNGKKCGGRRRTRRRKRKKNKKKRTRRR